MKGTDLGHLVALHALLQEGSVTEAARRVGLSTPAMSHTLARMRELFGDPLLVRAGRRMVLTERAQKLKPMVQNLVERAEELFSPGEDFIPAELDRQYVIRMTDYVTLVMGDTFDRLVREQAPALRLVFVPTTADDAEALRRGDADLAIGRYDRLPPELMTRKLVTDRFVCVLRKRHPMAGKRLTLKRYAAMDHVLVAPRGRPLGYLDSVLKEHGLERRVCRAVPSFHTAAAMVAGSDYVLTLSRRAATVLARQLHLAIVEPPVRLEPYPIKLVWHPRLDPDPAHRWLRGLWLTAAEKLS